jgi:hypothetical protein
VSRDTRDGRLPLRVSELAAWQVRMVPGQDRQVVCPDCGQWQVPRHGGFVRHDPPAGAGGRPCPGSGRRVWFDISPLVWWAQYQAAAREASSRSGRWAYRKVGTGRPAGRRYAGRRGGRPASPGYDALVELAHAARRGEAETRGRDGRRPDPLRRDDCGRVRRTSDE